jgi:hypothetical protein
VEVVQRDRVAAALARVMVPAINVMLPRATMRGSAVLWRKHHRAIKRPGGWRRPFTEPAMLS